MKVSLLFFITTFVCLNQVSFAQRAINKEVQNSFKVNSPNKTYSLFSGQVEPNKQPPFYKANDKYYEFKINQNLISDIQSKQPDQLIVDFQTDDYNFQLLLIKNKRAKDFQVVTYDGKNKEARPSLESVNYYGLVKNDPNSIVTLSIINDKLFALVSTGLGDINIAQNKETQQYSVIESWKTDVNPFSCHADELDNYFNQQMPDQVQIDFQPLAFEKCVQIYFEADYQMYLDSGQDLTLLDEYIQFVFDQVATIYLNENITLSLSEIFVWTTQDPYPHTSDPRDALDGFGLQLVANGGFNGDLAVLMSTVPLNRGGIAFLNGLCSGKPDLETSFVELFGFAYQYPTYSWDVHATAHELGHNFGSKHTHDCVWNFNNTAIDGCVATNGGCPNPGVPPSGTIMSYCHANSASSVDLANGFGNQPGDVIRNKYQNATCTGQCCIFDYVLDLGPDFNLCEGEAVLISAGVTGVSYLWSTGETTEAIWIGAAGTYSVEIYDECGSLTDEVNVTYNAGPVLDLQDTYEICDYPIVLDATTTGATTYLWSTGENTETITVTSVGTYWVQVYNDCGFSEHNFDVISGSGINFNIDPFYSICNGDVLTISAENPGSTYLWSTGETTPQIQISDSGTYWAQVTNDCASEQVNFDVDVMYEPELGQINGNTSFCAGESTQITISTINTNQILWSDGQTGPTATFSTPGIYYVNLSNICFDETFPIEIIEKPLPRASFDDSYLLCPGEAVTLDATNDGATYLWSDNSTEPTLTVDTAGDYWVEITKDGCVNTDSTSVNYIKKISVDLGKDINACLRDSVRLLVNVEAGESVLWSDGSTSSVFIAKESGAYSVNLSNLCETVSDEIYIEFYECCVAGIPTAFGPNSNGYNENFKPLITCDIDEYKFIVFNRWGEPLFETTQIGEGWDGKENGLESQPGTYLWTLSYFDSENNIARKYSGNVTLIR